MPRPTHPTRVIDQSRRLLRVAGAGPRLLALLLVLAVLPAMTPVLSPPLARADDGGAEPDRLPRTVAADALPTVQIDGVVWDQAVVGNTVYAVGQFSTARPAGSAPGQNEVPRSNALAYDITTGELKDWAPRVGGAIHAVEPSADGSTIYLGGDFTSLGDEPAYRIGAVGALDGARQSLPVSAGSAVSDLEVSPDGSTLYMAGRFTQVNDLSRKRVAAVDLGTQRITDFAPQVDDEAVRAITMARDGSALAIGGSFTSVNGQERAGLALLGADGALRQAEVNGIVTSGGPLSAVMNLAADGHGFYAVVYSRNGSFEGMLRADWEGGKVELMADCHGDSYDVHPSGDVVYVSSHAHDCSMIGGFPEQHRYWHAPAYSRDPVGEVGPSPDSHYQSYTGQPAAAQLHFYPVFTIGTFTAMNQATWTVEGNREYIVYGGEFVAVNNKPQQGLVRFARRDIAPNQEGPVDKGGAYRTSAASTEPGVVQISIPSNRDRDDQHLTYAVYRDPTGIDDLESLRSQTPVWTSEQDLPYWQEPIFEVRDEGAEAGSTHDYVVAVWDSRGAWTRSERMRVEVVTDQHDGQQDPDGQEEGGQEEGGAGGQDEVRAPRRQDSEDEPPDLGENRENP